MPTLYSGTADGRQGTTNNSNWDTAHDDVGQGTPTTNQTVYNYSITATYFPAPRDFYFTRRTFLDFDTSGITVAPSEATLKIYISGTAYDDVDIIAVKSAHDKSDTSEDWASTWLTNSPNSGTLSGWHSGSSGVNAYSAKAETTGAGTGYFNIPLNSTALNDMASLTTLLIVLM